MPRTHLKPDGLNGSGIPSGLNRRGIRQPLCKVLLVVENSTSDHLFYQHRSTGTYNGPWLSATSDVYSRLTLNDIRDWLK